MSPTTLFEPPVLGPAAAPGKWAREYAAFLRYTKNPSPVTPRTGFRQRRAGAPSC